MAQPQTFTHASGDPLRLDAFLTAQPIFRSRSLVQKYIKHGLVRVNGKLATKAGYELSEGDKVTVDAETLPALTVDNIESIDLKLPVLYEDDACMVINKPRNFSVHPAPTTSGTTVLHGIKKLFEERKLKFAPAAVLVHRLDKETTGCLLVAKNPDAHIFLQKQFEKREVEKRYLTLVYGTPHETKAMIDAPIGRHTSDRLKMSALHVGQTRSAQTSYETLGSAKSASLLLCNLHTGRTHQIRVHLQTIGHPVLGDRTYSTTASDTLSKKLGVNFLCLHAWKLQFITPASAKQISVTAPLPADVSFVLKNIALLDLF